MPGRGDRRPSEAVSSHSRSEAQAGPKPDAGTALAVAYAYLNTRERTVAEVRRKLSDAGVDPDAAAAAIAELHEQGYLDDARFARLFAQDKRQLEGWGNERIEVALRRHGIDHELIAGTLADGSGGELDRALEVLRRRFPIPPRTRRDRDRALGVILRKGYDSELALEALAIHARESPAA